MAKSELITLKVIATLKPSVLAVETAGTSSLPSGSAEGRTDCPRVPAAISFTLTRWSDERTRQYSKYII